jgi:hypothetical protein
MKKPYTERLAEWRERRNKIIAWIDAGKPKAVIARNLRISRQRVYQIAAEHGR